MSEKPEIKVGQRWLTRDGQTVRILATDSNFAYPVVAEFEDGELCRYSKDGVNSYELDPIPLELISLAPSTVKRTVALYRERENGANAIWPPDVVTPNWDRISEPVEVEFTLLPEEEA